MSRLYKERFGALCLHELFAGFAGSVILVDNRPTLHWFWFMVDHKLLVNSL